MKNQRLFCRSPKLQRGAALIEAALVIPVLAFLIFAGIDIFEVLYQRANIKFALQEGVRIAQADPRLKVDLFTLNPSIPDDATKISDFKLAREELFDKTIALIQARSLGNVSLTGSTMDGAVGGEDLKLALIPPSFYATVPAWDSKNVFNGYKCDKIIVSIKDPNDPTKVIRREQCSQTGNYAEQIAQFPTELHAFANIKTHLLGEIHANIQSDGYLPVVAGDTNTTTKTPAGLVVGGYAITYSSMVVSNGGNVSVYYSGYKNWGRTLLVPNVGGGGLSPTQYPKCENGLTTLFVGEQEIITQPSPLSVGIPKVGIWTNGMIGKNQFLCLTK